MKKTMFITSVIMVVVLAIALTTSSLAWFSAGGATTVGTNSVDIAAVNAQTIGSGLEIAEENGSGQPGTWTTANINLADPAGALDAMCPVGYTTKNNATTAEFYAAVNGMKTSKLITEDRGAGAGMQEYFAVAPSAQTAYKDTLFVRNSGSANDVNVRCNVSAGYTANSSKSEPILWVAVFDVTDSEHINLINISYSKEGTTTITYAQNDAAFGATESEKFVGNLRSSITGVAIPAAATTFVLEKGEINASGDDIAGGAHEIEVYAWFDGDSLYNKSAQAQVAISVTFEKVSDVANP